MDEWTLSARIWVNIKDLGIRVERHGSIVA